MGLGRLPPGREFPAVQLLSYGLRCLQVRGHQLLFLLVRQNICSYLETRMFVHLVASGEKGVLIFHFCLSPLTWYLSDQIPSRTSQATSCRDGSRVSCPEDWSCGTRRPGCHLPGTCQWLVCFISQDVVSLPA